MPGKTNTRKTTPVKRDPFRTTIFITERDRKLVGHLATERDTTKSDIIRQAIEAYLEAHKNEVGRWLP